MNPAEQAQIDQALARNAERPPLRDENGDVIDERLKTLYAQVAQADDQIKAARATKADATRQITEIEHAENEARMTGVTYTVGE